MDVLACSLCWSSAQCGSAWLTDSVLRKELLREMKNKKKNLMTAYPLASVHPWLDINGTLKMGTPGHAL